MRQRIRFQLIAFRVLFSVTLVLAFWLSQEHVLEQDWTHANRNTLSAESRRVLERMEGRIEVTAFAREKPLLRRRIDNLMGRYRRAYRDFRLHVIDPDLQPDTVRSLGIDRDGELLVRYSGRERRVQSLSESAVTTALLALSLEIRRSVHFLTGHGERTPTGRANHDLGEFGRRLAARGISVEELNLIAEAPVPGEVDVMVVAGPRTALLPEEAAWLRKFIESGGNLLWLADPDGGGAFRAVGDWLGITLLPGRVVNVAPAMFGVTKPDFTVIASYSRHPVTQNLRGPTLFPLTAALAINESEVWEPATLLVTEAGTWTETGARSDRYTLDPGTEERQGPHPIAVALTRPRPGGEQRVAVFGDGDFLSNAYLGNGANLALGLSLLDWLNARSKLVEIAPRTLPDGHLKLSERNLVLLAAGFLILSPGVLAVAGACTWWRRRHG